MEWMPVQLSWIWLQNQDQKRRHDAATISCCSPNRFAVTFFDACYQHYPHDGAVFLAYSHHKCLHTKESTSFHVPLSARWRLGVRKGTQAITNGLKYHLPRKGNPKLGWTPESFGFYMPLFVLAIIVTLLVLVLAIELGSCTENHRFSGEESIKVIGARTFKLCIWLQIVCSVSGPW